VRYGQVVSGRALAAVSAAGAALSRVPAGVLSSTIKKATALAAGDVALPGLVSGKVAALTEGVLKAMFLTKLKTTLTALLVLAAVSLGVGLMTGLAQSGTPSAGEGPGAANEQPAAGLTLAEFNELKPVLDLKNQPWTTIPWKYSITEARKLAAATKKPIFMVVNTGNCLGCV
jgi:hypothetical protein